MGLFFRKHLWPLVLLITGLSGMLALGALKEEIPRSAPLEKTLSVRVITARPENLSVILEGYGQARVLNAHPVSAEIKGKLAWVNPRLEPGEFLSKGDLLFRIDETRYQNLVQEQTAARDRLENRLKALETQHVIDLARYEIALRNQELAKAEYRRVSQLVQKQVGSRSQLERAELALNRARDLTAELSGRVKGFVYTLNQEKSNLDMTLARLASAQEDLVQCRVTAPFNARVKTVGVETGQYVMPGQKMALLADESLLELRINLDAREALEWLPMDAAPEKTGETGRHGFTRLKQTKCRVFWTDKKENRGQKAFVHRIVEFNPKTRSLVIAVRVPKENHSGFSIIEGMFCRVEIESRTRENLFCLPRAAVGPDNTVFLADQNRVNQREVEVLRIEKDRVYIKKGLTSGNLVILTPLSKDSQDSPLTIMSQKGENNEG